MVLVERKAHFLARTVSSRLADSDTAESYRVRIESSEDDEDDSSASESGSIDNDSASVLVSDVSVLFCKFRQGCFGYFGSNRANPVSSSQIENSRLSDRTSTVYLILHNRFCILIVRELPSAFSQRSTYRDLHGSDQEGVGVLLGRLALHKCL